jgi:AraC family transcriptional regulator, chitin signaling transcriptional activator
MRTWKFEVLPKNPNIIIQGNYYGLSILEKTNNQWIFKNKIKGFDYSSRYFELSNANEIYVSHEYKGIFRFNLNNDLTSISNLHTFSKPEKSKNAGLKKYNNIIYYACKDGIFKLNKKTKQFEKDKSLSTVFDNNEYSSGKLIVDESNNYGCFLKIIFPILPKIN